MKILIIYDSAFGNTEQIARSMGDALRSQDDERHHHLQLGFRGDWPLNEPPGGADLSRHLPEVKVFLRMRTPRCCGLCYAQVGAMARCPIHGRVVHCHQLALGHFEPQ